MKKLNPCAVFVLFLFSPVYLTAQSTDTLPVKDSAILEETKENIVDNIPVISLDENDLGEGGSQNISSLLSAGRDPFLTAASFNFSAARFRMRGYDGDMSAMYINGIPVDNLDNGFTPFGLWGGLNDVLRNKEVSIGLNYNTFSFGDAGTTTHIDARAAKQRKGTSIGYAWSNRAYTHRLMITHSTGLDGLLLFQAAFVTLPKVMYQEHIIMAEAALRQLIKNSDINICFH